MRQFEDGAGKEWDVVTGRESWGTVFAIFISRGGARELRQTPLDASSYEEANAELDGLDEEGLRELLARSEPKEIG